MPQSPENFLVFGQDGSISVKEGDAEILVRQPDPNVTLLDEQQQKEFAETVFYNPIQEFNRDMSILAISSWSMMEADRRRIENKKQAEKEIRRKAWLNGTKIEDSNVQKKNEVKKESKKNVEKKSDDSSEPIDKKRKITTSRKDYKIAQHDKKIITTEKPSPLQELPNPVKSYIEDWKKEIEIIHSDEGKELLMKSYSNWTNDKPSYTILEALAASGLRSIRYAKELKGVKKILCNDIDPEAVKSIKFNSIYNKVDDIIQPNQGDGSLAIYTNPGYTVVDLDPYGSAAPFLDAAVRSVALGGLLCITCTDLAVLAGSQSEACYAKYGSMAVANTPYCHEMALRILLQHVATTAAKYKRSIIPLASFSIDFYVRIFVRVEESASEVKELVGHSGMFYHCTLCKTVFTQVLGKSVSNGDGHKKGPAVSQFKVPPECGNCKGSYHVGGPIWLRPIQSPTFLETMKYLLSKSFDSGSVENGKSGSKVSKEDAIFNFGTYKRMKGMIELASRELPTQFYWSLPDLASVIHSVSPPLTTFVSAILNKGELVSQTHCKPNCFKTTATPEQIWDIIRDWVKLNPIKSIKANSVANILRSKVGIQELKDDNCHIESNFEKHPQSTMFSKSSGVIRFQENPTKYWGPKSKAKKRQD